jgi:hypothetical protein
MRQLALLLGIAYLVENTVAAFLMGFIATFPFENQDPDTVTKDDWLILVGFAMFFFALITLLAVIARRRGSAALMFAANSALTLALLSWALEASEHSDEKLILWTLAFELTGLGAVALRAPGPTPDSSAI